MSLLSDNQILSVLGLDNVAVVSRLRGWRSRILEQKHVTFTASSDEPVWQRAISQLDSMLALIQAKPKAKLQITLASDFVRYLALPPQPALMTSTEKMAYALAAYREIYGTAVDGWEIKLCDTPAHRSTIAVAVDKHLLETIRQIALKYQLKLATVQPYLMCVFNGLSSQITHKSGYLIIVEFNRLLLLNLHEGYCHNVRTYPLGNDWQAELKNVMMRESLLSGSSHAEILVYAPTQKNIPLNTINGWQIKRISTLKTSLINYHFAMLEVSV